MELCFVGGSARRVCEEMRTEMLNANYRLDADGHPELADRCAAVAQRLRVTAPVTLYQASGGLGLNAMLCHLPGEAHIVFTGPILPTLKGDAEDLGTFAAHRTNLFAVHERLHPVLAVAIVEMTEPQGRATAQLFAPHAPRPRPNVEVPSRLHTRSARLVPP